MCHKQVCHTESRSTAHRSKAAKQHRPRGHTSESCAALYHHLSLRMTHRRWCPCRLVMQQKVPSYPECSWPAAAAALGSRVPATPLHPECPLSTAIVPEQRCTAPGQSPLLHNHNTDAHDELATSTCVCTGSCPEHVCTVNHCSMYTTCHHDWLALISPRAQHIWEEALFPSKHSPMSCSDFIQM